MKKTFLVAALAGMALSSCVNDEYVVKETAQRLMFDNPVMNSQVRAEVKGEIVGSTYPEAEMFQVFAKSYSGDFKGWTVGTNDFFGTTGVTVKRGIGGSSYWMSESAYYWPDVTTNLAFAAYSPAELGAACTSTQISHTASGLQIDDFQVEAESDKQYDLMYSNRVWGLNKDNNGSKAVELNFKHALASIVFSSAAKKQAGITYSITDLKLGGSIQTKGDFSQGLTSAGTTPYSENANPVWSDLGNPLKPSFYKPSFTSFEVPESPEIFTSGTSAILPIPQDVPADAEVTIVYKVTNLGNTLTYEKTIKLSDFKQKSTGNAVDKWEMGNRYIYRIQFGETSRIYFQPTISDWKDQEVAIYTIE